MDNQDKSEYKIIIADLFLSDQSYEKLMKKIASQLSFIKSLGLHDAYKKFEYELKCALLDEDIRQSMFDEREEE
jgi:hypothetical protein